MGGLFNDYEEAEIVDKVYHDPEEWAHTYIRLLEEGEYLLRQVDSGRIKIDLDDFRKAYTEAIRKAKGE